MGRRADGRRRRSASWCRASRGRAKPRASATARSSRPRRSARTATRSAIAAASSSWSSGRSSACSAFSARAGPWLRLCRSTRRTSGNELTIRPAPRKAPTRRPWSPSGPGRSARRPAGRARQGAPRLAREREGREPHRHSRPWHPARVPEKRGPARGRGAAGDRGARRLAKFRWSPSIRSTPRTTTTRCTPRRSRSGQPRRPYRHRRHRRRRALRAARLGARPRGAQARQLGLFPRPRGADAARAHLQRSVLAPRQRGPRRARGAHDDRRRRPQALAHVSSRADALGRQAQLRAGASGDRRPHRRGHRHAARARGAAPLYAAYVR